MQKEHYKYLEVERKFNHLAFGLWRERIKIKLKFRDAKRRD